MKKISLLFALISCTLLAHAQYTPVKGLMSIYGSSGGLTVTNGASPATKATTAVLDLQSTSQGFLVPRMTQAQRDAISSPATGLLIYQTDGTAGFYSYSGAAWGSVGGATPLSSITAAAATNTIDNTNYAQTWNWSTADDESPLAYNFNALTSGTGFTIGSTSATASGQLFSVSSATAVAGIMGIAKFNFTGAYTGAGLLISDAGGTTSSTVAITPTALTTGSGLFISLQGTSAQNTQRGLNLVLNGVNATSGVTSYGADIKNFHAGTTSTNIGLSVTASGGTTANYAIIVPSGNVGIGNSAPTNLFTVGGSSEFQINSTGNIVKLNNVTTSFPSANSSGVLTNNGSGTLTWATPASGITIGTTTVTSGTNHRVPYELAGVVADTANFTMSGTTTLKGYLDVPTGYAIGGAQVFRLIGAIASTQSMQIGNGTDPLTNTITSSYSVWVGPGSGTLNSQSGNAHTALGYRTERGGMSGSETISIGAAANYQGHAFSYTGFIGSSGSSSAGMQNTASNQFVIGMPLGNGYTQFYFGQGVSAVTGTPSGVTFNATPGTTAGGLFTILGGAGSGTDKLGGNLVLGSGQSTGAAIAPDIVFQTSVATTTGTTAQTLGSRGRILGKYTTLTETTATSFARVNVPTSTVSGGTVTVTVEANDATEFQARTLDFAWSAANKAGATDADISTPVEVVSVSSGTLTVTITVVDAGSGNIDFKADATSSLTQTVLRANAVVYKNFGTGSISAQ